jgi:hypothetical protein
VSGPVESLHDRGRAAVLAGTESVDVPPNPSSPRWGLSVLLRPDDDCAGRLADQAAQLAALAGPHHWQTGGRGASHLTVCVLEPFREGVTPDDPHVRRAAAALSRAAARSAPVRFRLSGLLLAPGGVLAGGTPINPPAHRLRRIVADELGEAGRFEGSYRADRWWSTLLHFAGPVLDRCGLLDWVDARRTLDLGPLAADRLELARYAYDGGRTVPVPLASFPLGG